jgi:hypothetical protein
MFKLPVPELSAALQIPRAVLSLGIGMLTISVLPAR